MTVDLPQLTQVQQVALLMPCTHPKQTTHQRYKTYQPPWSLILTVDHVDRTEGWAWHASVALLVFDKTEGLVKPSVQKTWARRSMKIAQELIDGLLRGVGAGPDEQHRTKLTLQTWRPLTDEETRIALTRMPEDWTGG